MMHSS